MRDQNEYPPKMFPYSKDLQATTFIFKHHQTIDEYDERKPFVNAFNACVNFSR